MVKSCYNVVSLYSCYICSCCKAATYRVAVKLLESCYTVCYLCWLMLALAFYRLLLSGNAWCDTFCRWWWWRDSVVYRGRESSVVVVFVVVVAVIVVVVFDVNDDGDAPVWCTGGPLTTHSFASEVLHSVTVSPTLTPATFAFVILLLLALLFCYHVSLLFGYFCLCYFATFGFVVLLLCVFVIWLLLALLFR